MYSAHVQERRLPNNLVYSQGSYESAIVVGVKESATGYHTDIKLTVFKIIFSSLESRLSRKMTTFSSK